MKSGVKKGLTDVPFGVTIIIRQLFYPAAFLGYSLRKQRFRRRFFSKDVYHNIIYKSEKLEILNALTTGEL